MAVLEEIVAAEGPLTATRAYSLYNKSSGGKKLTTAARAPLSSALYWLAREGKIALVREADVPWQGDDVARMPDHPEVRVRELGPREPVAAAFDVVRVHERLHRCERPRRRRASSRLGHMGDSITVKSGLPVDSHGQNSFDRAHQGGVPDASPARNGTRSPHSGRDSATRCSPGARGTRDATLGSRTATVGRIVHSYVLSGRTRALPGAWAGGTNAALAVAGANRRQTRTA
jgi:hypothetical protein